MPKKSKKKIVPLGDELRKLARLHDERRNNPQNFISLDGLIEYFVSTFEDIYETITNPILYKINAETRGSTSVRLLITKTLSTYQFLLEDHSIAVLSDLERAELFKAIEQSPVYASMIAFFTKNKMKAELSLTENKQLSLLVSWE